jgi:hypothetical protein
MSKPRTVMEDATRFGIVVTACYVIGRATKRYIVPTLHFSLSTAARMPVSKFSRWVAYASDYASPMDDACLGNREAWSLQCTSVTLGIRNLGTHIRARVLI